MLRVAQVAAWNDLCMAEETASGATPGLPGACRKHPPRDLLITDFFPFFFNLINLCTFNILILYLLPNSSRGDGLRCCSLARVLQPQPCRTLIAEVLSAGGCATRCIAGSSGLEGGLDPAGSAAECIRAVVQQPGRGYGIVVHFLKFQILNAMFIKKSRVFRFWGFSYCIIIIILRNSSM